MNSKKVVISPRYRVTGSQVDCCWTVNCKPQQHDFAVSEDMLAVLNNNGSQYNTSYVALLNGIFTVITTAEADALELPPKGVELAPVYDQWDHQVGWAPRIVNGGWLDIYFEYHTHNTEPATTFHFERLTVDYPVSYKSSMATIKRYFSSFGEYGFCQVVGVKSGPSKTNILSQGSVVSITSRKFSSGSGAGRIQEMLMVS